MTCRTTKASFKLTARALSLGCCFLDRLTAGEVVHSVVYTEYLSEEDKKLAKYENQDLTRFVTAFLFAMEEQRQEIKTTETTPNVHSISFELTEGNAIVDIVDGEQMNFSQNFACPDCNVSIDEVEPRRRFIMDNAQFVKNLDI